jgi:hypothetical protein
MPDADPIAGDARLRHFEQGIADPVMIANAHFGIRQSLDCEILSELAMGKVVSTELVLPITIRFDLVDKDCPVLAAMPSQISLAVTLNVEPPSHSPALNRCPPDGGVDGSPLPLDVAWPAHIYRGRTRHRFDLLSERPKSKHVSAGADNGGGTPLRQGQSPATPPA